jgi:PKHD-type hydroxylase
MIFTIKDILTKTELEIVVNSLKNASFVEGKITAGWHAKLVKNNQQISKQTPNYQNLQKIIKQALLRNPLFQSAAQPKVLHSLLFSRYEQGMYYGSHVDNSLMGKNNFWRSDLSFTIFLSSPSSYGGGELVIEESDGDRYFKLELNSALIYPSCSLHRVEKVTQGTRLVAVGWVQSLIRDHYERAILFDLDTVRRSIFAQQGKTIEFDLITKSYVNLLRKWSD